MKTVPNTLGCLEEKPSKPGVDATLIWVKRSRVTLQGAKSLTQSNLTN